MRGEGINAAIALDRDTKMVVWRPYRAILRPGILFGLVPGVQHEGDGTAFTRLRISTRL